MTVEEYYKEDFLTISKYCRNYSTRDYNRSAVLFKIWQNSDLVLFERYYKYFDDENTEFYGGEHLFNILISSYIEKLNDHPDIDKKFIDIIMKDERIKVIKYCKHNSIDYKEFL